MPLRFVYQQTLVSGGTAGQFGTDAQLSLNSPYAPGGGSLHQPYGWDNVTPFYRRYKCTSADVRLTFSQPGATAQIGIAAWRVVPPGASGTFSGTTVSNSLERPDVNYAWIVNGGGKPVTRTFHVDFAKQAGISKLQFDADVSEYAAAVTADPSRLFKLYISHAHPTLTAQTVYCLVEIIYHVEFSQRTTLAQS
jgi:hypothetical protein